MSITKHSIASYFWVITALFASNIDPILVKLGYMSTCTPWQLLCLKHLGGALVICLLTRKARWVGFQVLMKEMLPAALLLLLTSTLTLLSLQYIGASLLLTILTITPAAVALTNKILGRDILGWKFWLGFFLCAAGLWLTLGYDFVSFHFLGIILALGAVISSTTYRVLQENLTVRHSPSLVSTYIFIINGICMLPLFPGLVGSITMSAVSIGSVLGLTAALANLAFLWAISLLGSTRVSIIGMLQRPLVIGFSALVLRESLGFWQIVGTVLVLVGIQIAKVRRKTDTMQRILRRSLLEPLLARFEGRIEPASAIATLSIGKMTCHPERIDKDTAFFFVPGETRSGDGTIDNAVRLGAACIISEKEQPDITIPQIIVKDARDAFAGFSAELFDHASRKLRLIGVTGTNGKTTTTHLIEYILKRSGLKAGLIGTLGFRSQDQLEMKDFGHTTPPAAELEEILAGMAKGGCGHVALEVSSHALIYRRVGASHFAAAVLTNVTQDHLDFHKTVEHYWQAKRRLFESLNSSSQSNKIAIINFDDPLYREFSSVCSPSVRKLNYGFSASADIHVKRFDWTGTHTCVQLATPYGPLDFQMLLPGRFNIYNAMSAIAICLHEGVPKDSIACALNEFPGVNGRFERISKGCKSDPLCIIDYAHTPDGLEKVLQTASELRAPGAKLICVFGCGGNTDPSKRPKMGKVAETLADEIVITSDNPRMEDPSKIIEQILEGIEQRQKVAVELDRANAIRLAVSTARSNDIVLVAGKGHEKYQSVMDQIIPFEDRVELLKALRER